MRINFPKPEPTSSDQGGDNGQPEAAARTRSLAPVKGKRGSPAAAAALAVLPMSTQELKIQLDGIVAQISAVKETMKSLMVEGVHYGLIPKTDKRTLLQPGADVIMMLLRLRPEWEMIDRWCEGEHLGFIVRCDLYGHSGNLVSSQLAACNSREWRYQKTMKTRQVPSWDLENTILKMACKRAKVGAVQNASACSDLFTQDIEDNEEDDAAARTISAKVTIPPAAALVSEGQLAIIRNAFSCLGKNPEEIDIKQWLKTAYKVTSLKDLSAVAAESLIRQLDKRIEDKAKAAAGGQVGTMETGKAGK